MNKTDLFVGSGLIIALVIYVGFSFQHSTESIPFKQLASNQNKAMTQVTQNITKQFNDSSQMISDNVAELQSEVIKLRNQLDPRNISEAFPLYPTSSVDAPNNTYAEQKEGSIAGLGPSLHPVPVK